MEDYMSCTKNYWDNQSDSYYKRLNVEKEISDYRDNPKKAFHPDTLVLIENSFSSLKGVDVCVLASGDNLAVFAFALLGAKVTSVDISNNQLKNAKKISDWLGLDINYICSDIQNLSTLKNNNYDLVFTSNGVFVWLPDLSVVFAEVYRILKTDAFYLFHEVHPFTRPWENSVTEIKMKKPYFDIGPFGEKVKNYHWKLEDIFNNLMKTNLEIIQMKEGKCVNDSWWKRPSYENDKAYTISLHDWKKNPLAGLPAWLSVLCKK